MPPKKKTKTIKQETSNNEVPKEKKQVTPEPPKKIEQSKNNPNPPAVNKNEKKEDQKKNEKNEEGSQKIIDPLEDHHHQMGKKVSLDENKNMTEAEILEKRRLRFKVMGTQVDAEEAERIKKERLEKFGGNVPLSKQALQKRKQKFGLKPVALDEDKETIEKRREKFGGNGGPAQKQDPETISKRKQKFGGNDISLDDEIQKAKDQQNRNFKRSNPKHGFRDNSHHNPKKFRRY